MKRKNLFILFGAFCLHGFSQVVVGLQIAIGGIGDDQLGGLWLTTDGGMVPGGRSYSYISGEKTVYNRGVDDYRIVKLDREGDIQWQKVAVSLVDQPGRVMYTSEINNSGKRDISTFPGGLYYIKNEATGATQQVIIKNNMRTE